MRATGFRLAAVLATLAAAATVAAEDRAPAAADMPAVPPLVVGADAEPRAFVVRGSVLLQPGVRLGFHIAADGRRQLCAIYDPADGTPLLLSDGRETLMYDLLGDRIVRVRNATVVAQVDWDANDERPLKFNWRMGFDEKGNPDQTPSAVRLDRFVEASRAALRRIESPGGTALFAAERKNGTIDAVQVTPGDASRFRFRSTARDGGEDHQCELDATHVGGPVPDAALAFPDLERLGRDIRLAEYDRKWTLESLTRDAMSVMTRLVLRGDDDMRRTAERAAGKLDWDDLRPRDERLGKSYRAALAAQHVRFPAAAAAAEPEPAAGAGEPTGSEPPAEK